MPMLKTITGHTGCAGVMDYLRKGSRTTGASAAWAR